MTTSSFNQRRLIIFILVVLIVVIASWFLIPSRSVSDLPTISFTGIEPGKNPPSAAFWVTNTTRQSIYLMLDRVQIVRNGTWDNLPESKPPVVSTTSGTGTSPAFPSPLKLAPGEYRKILVATPEVQPWRVSIEYRPAVSAVRLLLVRLRLALAFRTFSNLPKTIWVAKRTVISETITNSEPGP